MLCRCITHIHFIYHKFQRGGKGGCRLTEPRANTLETIMSANIIGLPNIEVKNVPTSPPSVIPTLQPEGVGGRGVWGRGVGGRCVCVCVCVGGGGG